MELTDADLMLRLTDTEDSFTERKTVNDLKDCLKTAVGFANTAPIDYPAVLFVGVRDNGEVEGVTNPEKIHKTVSEYIGNAYPTIYYATRVLQQNDKTFLAVIIPGSASRPHFAGPSYVREGNKTVVASHEQFDRLIAERNSKAYEILKWRGRVITKRAPTGWDGPVQLLECNQFFVTITTDGTPGLESIPLRLVDLDYDHRSDCLALRVQRG